MNRPPAFWYVILTTLNGVVWLGFALEAFAGFGLARWFWTAGALVVSAYTAVTLLFYVRQRRAAR